MKTENKIKLGIFVLSGITFLILGLYYIGSKRNIFHLTINVSTVFNNVNGLLPGNNVRFNGINVGTVSAVNAVSDTSIKVDFTVEEDLTKFISKNAITSIGTDGVLGNKLVNITCKEKGKAIQEGDMLRSLNSVQMENAMRTLTITNTNLKDISENLKNVTDKLNNSHSLWNLLSDTTVAENVKSSIINIKIVSNQSAIATGNLKDITEEIKKGKGSLGALLTDTLLFSRVKQTVVKLEKISDTASVVTEDISSMMRNIKQGKGSIGVLLKDTTLVHNLNQSIVNINKTSITANQDLEGLKHSFLLRKYFRKQKKEKRNAL